MERVDLRRLPHAERARWRNGGPWDPGGVWIAVGQLGSSWYCRWHDLTGWEPPACVYSGPHAEHYARGAARRWRRTFGGEWVEA